MILKKISYRNKLLLTFLLFTFFIVSIFAISMHIYTDKKYSQNAMLDAEKTFSIKTDDFLKYKALFKNTIMAISSSKIFKNYIDKKNKESFHLAEELFINFASTNDNIMQLRYIDKEGMEKIRVERKKAYTLPYLVSQDKLQNKKNRYYFLASIHQKEAQIWSSKIDLNIEHGEIEKPIEPVLRFATPIYALGKLKGILIINIFMKDFLNKFVNSLSSDIYLLDHNNHILVSTNKKNNWSYYLSHKKSPLLFKRAYYYKPLDPSNDHGLQMLIVPKASLYSRLKSNEYQNILIIIILISLLSIPFAYFFSLYPSRLEKEIENHNIYLQTRINKAVIEYEKTQKILMHQSRLAQMGEMLSMIAHQWRQPLSTISAISNMLKIKTSLNQFTENLFTEKLDKIESLTQHLSNTINDFKDYYKPDTKMINITTRDVVSKSLSIIRPSLESSNIEIIENYHSNEYIEIYEGQIIQVILNILKNAQDNFEEQKIENAHIEITVENTRISICNNGGTISPKHIDKIFDPYFSTKNDKNGTGLGLYMSKNIIEKHARGKLSVKNTDDGVCFIIEI